MADRFVRACRWAASVMGRRGTDVASVAGTRRARWVWRTTGSGRLRDALAFTGLAVEPGEVRALASLVGRLACVPSIPAACALLLAGGGVALFAPALFAVPLLATALVLGYPGSLATRQRLAAVGEAPEVITYLAMSLLARPALDRAVAFTADHTEGVLAGSLRRALWDVHLRTRARIEDAFLAVADAWGPGNEDLKQALYVIGHAATQGSEDGLARALDRARTIVYEGTRRRLQDYAAALRGPTTALFALGVLLPLIVGSMVPLLSLGSVVPLAVEAVDPRPANPLPWILLLDVAFPALTFAMAHHVSSRRPGLAVARRRPFPFRAREMALLGLAPFAAATAFLLHADTPILALGGVVAVVSFYLHLATRAPRREARRVEALEQGFPDALFQLGSRLGDGRGLEASLAAVARDARGTSAGDLFGRIAHALRFGDGGVDVLFGRRGTLRAIPSRLVHATLKMVVDLAAKDPAVAGHASLEMSSHLRELRGVERDLRAQLRPTVDAMRATGAVFAPVVLGVTGALYGLLADGFAPFASLPMDPPMFHAVLGVYLLGAMAAIVHFVTRIDAGRDEIAFGATLARMWPTGYGIFLAAVVLSNLAF